MAVIVVGLIPGLMVQVGHEPLGGPEAPEAYVTPRKDVRAPVPIKDVRAERVIAVPVPKPPRPVLASLAPRPRVPAKAGLVVTEPREAVRALALQGALARPRLLGRADGPGARLEDALAPSGAEVVIHKDVPPDSALGKEVRRPVPCAPREASEAPKVDTFATNEVLHGARPHPGRLARPRA